MAEIRIQRKRRRKKWPWVLGAAVLAVLLVVPFRANRDETAVPAEGLARGDPVTRGDSAARVTTAAGTLDPTLTTTAAPVETSGVVPVSAFDRFIRAGNAAANEHGQRQYTAEALRRLADELRTHGASEAGVDAIRAHADSLRMSGGGPNASRDYARAAFLEVVRELDLLGERRGVPVDTARLRAAAWAISPRPELLAQRTTVQAFFETARDALHALARRR